MIKIICACREGENGFVVNDWCKAHLHASPGDFDFVCQLDDILSSVEFGGRIVGCGEPQIGVFEGERDRGSANTAFMGVRSSAFVDSDEKPVPATKKWREE